MKSKTFVKGAIILIVFNLIGKIVGAIYRIPLANLLGAEGMGKYQLVFPLYSLLLSISISGIPVAISKLVAEYNSKGQFGDSKRLLRLSLVYLFVISLFSSVIVVILAGFIAKLQGNSEIYLCYYGIAPAILFVGVLSVFRGYFQGNLKMIPTAISNLIEQVGKLVFGLFFTYKFIGYGLVYGVFGAVLGISISELLALIFLGLYYLIYSKKYVTKVMANNSKRGISRKLFEVSVPITLGGMAGPITSIIDSMLVVNLLIFSGFGAGGATSLLGLQSGIVEPLINIPIVIAVAISSSLLPNLSSAFAKDDEDEVKNLIEKAFQIILSVSVVCSICYVIFGKQVLNFLYHNSLSYNELMISTKLLFLGSVNLILLSLVQLSAGILQGMGKQNLTVKSLLIGSGIKIILNITLVSLKPINIYGAMISGALSYLVILIINYGEIKKQTAARIGNVVYGVAIQECLVCLFAFFTNILFNMAFGEGVALFAGGITAVIIFMVSYYTLFVIDKHKTISW